jgi:CHAT domain-containing protein
LREGIEANESARRQLAGEQESAAIYMKDKEALYKRMVETLLAQGRTSDALRYAEMAKGRVVLDILQGTRAALNKSLSPEEQQRETALRSRVAVLSGELARVSSSNSARAAGIRASLENARQEQRSLLNTLYAAHPQLRLQRVDFETESPAGAVDASTAMLEYVVGDRAIYLFAITREETRVFTLAIAPDQAGRDVARFRQQIATRDLGYGVSARALYRTLLAPAAAALRGKSTLVIVPDGFLWQLPFQALQPAAGRHLLEDVAVFYSPSLTVLREMTRAAPQAHPTSPRLLALGATSLAAGQREVAGLRGMYGAAHTTTLLAAEADEEVVRREAPNYDVLHLAAHGVFQAQDPMLSYLALAKEGKLEAREMMSLDLHADLVVLSGCETGRGGIGNGEGLIGMSWALFVAGSPTTVASQWKVDAASTSEMMLAFHANLRRNGAKARALQQAALSVMRKPEYRHPFYWSGFVMMGRGY